MRWRDATGTTREVRTDEPGLHVASVVAALGREPDGLEVIRPTLEDIYLGLVRDASTGSASELDDTELDDTEEALA